MESDFLVSRTRRLNAMAHIILLLLSAGNRHSTMMMMMMQAATKQRLPVCDFGGIKERERRESVCVYVLACGLAVSCFATGRI